MPSPCGRNSAIALPGSATYCASKASSPRRKPPGRQAVALDPDHAGAHSHLGNVLSERGDLGAAEAAYRRAIALKPNFAEAYNNLGADLEAGGPHGPDSRIVEQAIRPVPKSALHYLNLSEIRRFTPKTILIWRKWKSFIGRRIVAGEAADRTEFRAGQGL